MSLFRSLIHLTFEKIANGAIWIIGLISAVLIFQTVVVANYKIPTGSMIPTLMVGDYLFVSKFAYALKLPIPFTNINVFEYDHPKRGDVIVFQYPDNPSLDYIKRVVAIPGDTVQLKGPQLYINNEPVLLRSLYKGKSKNILGMTLNTYSETIEKKIHKIQHIQYLEKRSFGPVEVPSGRYFVLGDNRDNSRDSRIWGMVPFGLIKGKAVIIWFSMDETESHFRDSLRSERFFKLIQ